MSLKLLPSPLSIPFKSPVIMHPGFIIWFMIRTWRTPPTGEKSLWFTVLFSFAVTWLTSGATVRISWIFRPTSKSVFIITWSPRKRTVSVFLFSLHFWARYAVLPFQQLFHFKTLVKKGSRGISWRGIPLLFSILIFVMGRSSRWAFFGAASRLRSMPTLFPTFLVNRGRGGRSWYIWWWIAWWWGGGGGWRRRRRGGGSRYFPFFLQPKKKKLTCEITFSVRQKLHRESKSAYPSLDCKVGTETEPDWHDNFKCHFFINKLNPLNILLWKTSFPISRGIMLCKYVTLQNIP